MGSTMESWWRLVCADSRVGWPSTRATRDFKERGLENTQPGLWSRQSLADYKLAVGARDRFTNRTEAEKNISEKKAL